MTDKKMKWSLFRNYFASGFAAIVAGASWYMYKQGARPNDFFRTTSIMFGFAFMVTIVLNVRNRKVLNKGIQTADAFSLFPGEEILKEYVGINLDGYAFLSWEKLLFKNVLVTNKRVVLSSNIFGVQSYKGALSMFYNRSDYEKANRLFSLFMFECTKEDNTICLRGIRKMKLSRITWKIKDHSEIYDMVKRYKEITNA